MKVKDLITELKKFDQDMDLVVDTLSNDKSFDWFATDIIKVEPRSNIFGGTDLCIYFLE